MADAAPRTNSVIPFIDVEELPADLAEAFAPRIERLGYLGDFFRAGAHQPRALLAFHQFTEELKAALPPELVELVALRVANRLGNVYERNQHERLAQRQGRSAAWIGAAEDRPGADRAALSGPTEEAVAKLVDALLQDAGHGSATPLSAVAEMLGPADSVALLLLVGRYLAHATVANALGLEAPVPPVLADDAGLAT